MPGYPVSEGWALSYAFSGPKTFNIAVSDTSNNTYNIDVDAATSQNYPPGIYTWVAYVTLNSERHQVASGTVVLQQNLASAPDDNRSHDVKMVALIKAELERRLTGAAVAGGQGAIEKYAIHGRSIERLSTAELTKQLVKYEWRVYRQQNPGRLGTPVQSRFTAPGGYTGVPTVTDVAV